MLQKMKKACHVFHREEDGPTAVEYAVVVSLIAAVCIGSVLLLGEELANSFDRSSAAIDQSFNN
ncbi:MAG: Flp family type IVb pilin [Planctomycetota bacterium]